MQDRPQHLDTAVHALVWLNIANAIGLLLAVLLLAPALNGILAHLTYGRWMPLHLNLQLYGWCAIPLIGLLFRLYLPVESDRRLRRTALDCWAVALAFGALGWLGGYTSGKLFLDWQGPARLLLLISMSVLWSLLLVGQIRQRQCGIRPNWREGGRWLLLLVLLPVPWVLYASAAPGVYPPVNPDSGGPTGSSLLGSTLGLIPLFLMIPHLLGKHRHRRWLSTAWCAPILLMHTLFFAVMSHHDASGREPLQVLAVASVIIWLPLLVWHFRRFSLPRAERPWLLAFGGWAVWLVLSSIVEFHPAFLVDVKFTNALAGHSHAAMGGMLSSLNMVILLALNRGRESSLRVTRLSFWLWQTGLAVQVVGLTWLGLVEGEHPGVLFSANSGVTAVYTLRLMAGVLMFGASWSWLRSALRTLTVDDSSTSASIDALAPLEGGYQS